MLRKQYKFLNNYFLFCFLCYSVDLFPFFYFEKPSNPSKLIPHPRDIISQNTKHDCMWHVFPFYPQTLFLNPTPPLWQFSSSSRSTTNANTSKSYPAPFSEWVSQPPLERGKIACVFVLFAQSDYCFYCYQAYKQVQKTQWGGKKEENLNEWFEIPFPRKGRLIRLPSGLEVEDFDLGRGGLFFSLVKPVSSKWSFRTFCFNFLCLTL